MNMGRARLALLPLVMLTACRVPPPAPQPYQPLTAVERTGLGCYLFTDPGDTSRLPISLDSNVVRVLGDSLGSQVVLRQLHLPAQVARRYAYSGWYRLPGVRGDSLLFLDISDMFTGFLFEMRPYPDSLAGVVYRCADTGGCRDPVPAMGRRVPCAV